MSWLSTLSFAFLAEPGFLIILAVFFVIAFCLGYYWQGKESRVKWLIEQANLKTQQINELESVNKTLEDKNRELYAKELELTMANRRLQSLEEAKSKFISVTTHQLRTPLAAVKWTLDMAAKGQLGAVSEDQKKFLGKGLVSIERVIDIVNDLLKVDLIDENQSDYHFKETDIVKMIDDIIFEFTNQALVKHIELKFTKPNLSVPLIEIDSDKVRMVIENLIDNATKYTPENGKIEVKLSDERVNSAEGMITISVSDSGIGIPSTETDKIFHKFFRASNAIKVEPDGSGIGLFIAQDIIEKHGGAIWFQSTPGRGTTFSFTLPLHQKKV